MHIDKNNLDAIFSALSHPIRRSIIEQVSASECTVNELAGQHEISRPAISQHLHILVNAKLIEQTKKGRIRVCNLNGRPLSIAFNWLVRYRIFWDNLLDDIQKRVEPVNDKEETNNE